MKRFDYLGYRIEYSSRQKRWFVQDWDYETGYYDVGKSHASKYEAMAWCEGRSS